MYMLNMVIILIVMYCNVVTAIDKIPTYLLRFNKLVPIHARNWVYVTASALIKGTQSMDRKHCPQIQ